jgi:hypothetical protein
MAGRTFPKPSERTHEENLEELKKAYAALQKRYGLPKFDELDIEFEIRKIDYDLFIVKEVRRVMMQKLDFMVAVLEPILNPSPSSLHSFIETKIFAKHNIEPMFDFYKKVWQFMHRGVYASYLDEKSEAEWINEVWKAWPAIKKEAAGYAKQVADGWSKVEKDVFSDKYLQ